MNHVRYIRQLGHYTLPLDTFGTPVTESLLGGLTLGSPAAGHIPVSWLGTPGVHLQTATKSHPCRLAGSSGNGGLRFAQRHLLDQLPDERRSNLLPIGQALTGQFDIGGSAARRGLRALPGDHRGAGQRLVLPDGHEQVVCVAADASG